MKLIVTGLHINQARAEARALALQHNQPYSVIKLNKRACGRTVYGVYEGMIEAGQGTAAYVARPAALRS